MYLHIIFSVPNGKYIDEPKFIHNVSSLEDPKYTTCHMEDQTLKQQQQFSSNLSIGGGNGGAGGGGVGGVGGNSCHQEDTDNMTVIKSEDGISHYVLPPFLR